MTVGWRMDRLGEILAVLKNGLNCKQDKSGQGQRLSRIESISQGSFDLGKVGYAEISVHDKRRFRLSRGDILFSHINSPVHVGKTAVFDLDEEVYHGVNLLLMRPKSTVLSGYLGLYLKYLFERGYWLSVCKQSVNQASVNQQDISRVPISYPVDLAEQRRIVAILDEAFEGIATARANAEKNLQNGRSVFNSLLNSMFASSEWQRKTIGELFRVGSSKRILKSQWQSQGIPFYRGREVTRLAKDGFVDNELFISEALYAELSSQYGVPDAGDIMVTAIGTIGNAYVVRQGDQFYFKDASVLWLKKTADVSSEFINYWLRSDKFFGQLDRGNGATVDTLTIRKLQSVTLSLPSLAEQHRIVVKLDALADSAERLEELYGQKLAALDELKKSLLHQAFTGVLSAKSTDQQLEAVA